MRFLRPELAGSPAPGTPAPRRPAGAGLRLALATLALATLGVGGCASGPCSTCGIGNGIATGFRRFGDGVQSATARVFHHKKAGCDTCGDGGAVTAEGSTISGGMIMPGPVIQAPSMGGESNPTILTPAPPDGGTGTGTTGGGKSSSIVPQSRGLGNRQSANARLRSTDGQYRGRGDNLARAALGPPSAERSASGAATAARQPSAASLLDQLPPVEPAYDVARRASSPPVPLEAEQVRPAGAAGPDETSPILPAIRASIDTTTAPGLAHFSGVRPNVSGGSLPGPEGLDWLKEKGIKTLLDLRATDEVDKAFVEQVKARGLLYISLPIVATRLDASQVARFSEEVARRDGHPVYFFDADGTRAGELWYVHRLTVDRIDAQLANREAEELGLTARSRPIWVAAASYIDSIKPAAKPPAGAVKPAIGS